MLKNVSKKMWDSLHLFRSRRVILPEKAEQQQTLKTGDPGQSGTCTDAVTLTDSTDRVDRQVMTSPRLGRSCSPRL